MSPARVTARQRQLDAAYAAVLAHPGLTAYQLAPFIPDGETTPAPAPAEGGLDLGLPPAPPQAVVSTGRALTLLAELERSGRVRKVLSDHNVPRWLWEAAHG